MQHGASNDETIMVRETPCKSQCLLAIKSCANHERIFRFWEEKRSEGAIKKKKKKNSEISLVTFNDRTTYFSKSLAVASNM